MERSEMEILKSRYNDIIQDLIKKLNAAGEEIDIDGDVVDEIQGRNIAEIQNKISQNNLMRLRALQQAIRQIERGEYGFCEECGEEIGVRRLQAMPGVSVCIACAEHAEMRK